MFRLWMSMPAASDPLLRELPRKYADEIRRRVNDGEQVVRTVGVRALLALHDSPNVDPDGFRELLEDLRANPEPPDQVAEVGDFDAADIVTELDARDVEEMVDRLRNESLQAAEIVAAAVEEIRAGGLVSTSAQEAISSWNTSLVAAWETLGVAAVPADASFGTLESVTTHLARMEQEAARRIEEERQREDKLSKLEQLRKSAHGLEPLVSDETFRNAYERALEQIAELEQEIGESAQEDMDASGRSGEARAEGSPGPGASTNGDTAKSAPGSADMPQGDTTEPPSGDEGTETIAVAQASPAAATEIAESPAPRVVGELSRRVAAKGRDVVRDVPVQAVPAGAQPDNVATARAAALSPVDLCEESAEVASPLSRPDRAATAPGSDPAGTEPRVGAPHSGDYDDDLSYHVSEGRFGAAWLVARAAGFPTLDVMSYRLAAAAFHSAPGGIDPAEVLIRLTTMPEGQDFSTPQTAKVALAATLRAALAAGWIPRSELESIVRQANLDNSWRDLIDAAIAASDRNYQHLHDFGGRLELSIDNVHENTRAVRTQLQSQRIKFARADKVLKYLLRSSEPLGMAFEAVLAPSTGEERREALTDVLGRLDDPDALIDDVDSVVNSPQQRRAIVAHARASLRKAIESVRNSVTEALNTAAVVASDSQAAVTQEARHNLVAAAKALEVDPEAVGPGDTAMSRLVMWIISPAQPTRVTDELQALIDESLPVTCADRDGDGLPIIHPVNAERVVDELRAPRSARELFEAFVSRGDLQEAAAVAARHAPELQERLTTERSTWRRRLSREVAAVRAELGHTYADDFTLGAHAEAEAQLVTPAGYSGDRFDLQVADLERLRGKLADYRARTADALRGRVGEETSTPADRDRITALIDAEDFVGANELLALARTGTLPAPDDDDTPVGSQVFDAYTEMLATLDLPSASTIHEVVAQINGTQADSKTAIDHGDLTRLSHWDNLLQKGSGGRANRQATLSSILRALGLDTRGELSRYPLQGARHFERYRVNAAPVDGSLVPALGSQATQYIVVATSDHKLLRDTLANGFPTKNGPNIVLFDGVLTFDERRQCLNMCREQKVSALVIDHAVAAFVASRYPRSFRAVQQLTLPFTCFTHYTVVAGNVPDEVFVGRADELTTLTDRAGSLFVYGGRQLGKSALLRKIQRDFNAVPDQHAIFIDLNSHGIGSWADSQRLWPVLYNELAEIGSIGVKANMAVRNPEPVTRAIRQWLDGKESRRLLLLLDEADAFLEKESSESPRAFKNVGPLKGLFDDTAGRFKPVFAGLHKVQRLQNVANTPLAHGGRDVLIGPLAAKPARDLVVKPLEALGYRFDNPEAVWRLLAFTNLQPGLIQVVCNDLIAHLQSRTLHKDEPLITISDADIDTVTQDPRTRDKIAEKLRLTIALEDRYRVIALAVAIMCMEDNFREKYPAADIRLHCEVYWQQGFEDLNSSEFMVYLDELVGLGVLIKDRDDRFSVRSPNIVTMLGSKEQLEIELDENKEQFELPHEYNPRSTRRQLTIDGTTVRSPLSEHDLSQLIPVMTKYEPARNFVIVGSDALGITDVARVVKSVGDERATDVTISSADGDIRTQLSRFKFAGGGNSAPRLLLIDASRANPQQSAEIATAVQSMRRRGQGHLVVVYGTDGTDAASHLIESRSVVDTRPINLEKWSGDGIRSWHDNPFNTPADRRQLLIQSGGWPELVERAVTDVSNRGISHAEEWDRLSSFPADEDAAHRFLHSVGVGLRAREILTQWAQLGSTSHERIADIAEVLDLGASDMHAIATGLARLGALNERHDEYMIDPVVTRALSKLV